MPSFQQFGPNVSANTDNFEPFDYNGSDDDNGFGADGFDTGADPFNFRTVDDNPNEPSWDTYYNKTFHEGARTNFEPDYDFTDSLGQMLEHVEHSEENEPDDDSDNDDPSDFDEFDEVNQFAEVNEHEEVDTRDEIGTEEEIGLDEDDDTLEAFDFDYDTTDEEFERQQEVAESHRFLLNPFEDDIFTSIFAETMVDTFDPVGVTATPIELLEQQLDVFPPLPSQASVLDGVFDDVFADLLDVRTFF